MNYPALLREIIGRIRQGQVRAPCPSMWNYSPSIGMLAELLPPARTTKDGVLELFRG